ncbi:MAG: rhomboid family intramembrane serine protease [Bacteroidota bacterium]|nr:rhomboid family intramembrane serine protease [Bacteroidota bacterium]
MITIIIVAVTSAISMIAFNNQLVFSKLQFSPYQVYHRKEYYRLLSHGFIHADWTHLIVNMFVLYSFGIAVEKWFLRLETEGLMRYAEVWFVVMYLVSIVVSSLTTLKKQKDNVYYNAVGASGAVSAVLFCSIFFSPFSTIGLYLVIPMPAIVFGVLYLVYSQYMSRKNTDNVNHDAHFVGAVFGFLFPLLINVKFIYIFIEQLFNR